MKIVIDAYGGDNSPSEIVKGAIMAINEREGFDIVLVGKEDGIKSCLSEEKYDEKRVSILSAEEVITCNETPTEAVRHKQDSSIVKGVKLLREDKDATAFVSAGSTGAVLTAAVLMSPRIRGIIRPALAPALPTVKGGNVLLLDCGANVDCKPINLVQFAIMGSVYMREVYGIENPKVALLSNGTEDKKGCALTLEAFNMLKETKGINFVGNMESREILSGDIDVVVTDGFYGNIALKAIEGTALAMMTILKSEIKKSKKSMLGAMIMKPALKSLKNTLDYNKKGGAVLLGMENAIVKAHGSSKAESFKNAIYQAVDNSLHSVGAEIKAELNKINGESV